MLNYTKFHSMSASRLVDAESLSGLHSEFGQDGIWPLRISIMGLLHHGSAKCRRTFPSEQQECEAGASA